VLLVARSPATDSKALIPMGGCCELAGPVRQARTNDRPVAERRKKGKIALGFAKNQFKTMTFLLGRIFFLLTCPLMGGPMSPALYVLVVNNVPHVPQLLAV